MTDLANAQCGDFVNPGIQCSVPVDFSSGLVVAGGISITGGLTADSVKLSAIPPGPYANDVAAAAGGVHVGDLYRSGSALMVRVA